MFFSHLLSHWPESETKMSLINGFKKNIFSVYLRLWGQKVGRMSLSILPRELLEMVAFHLDVSSTIAFASCSSNLLNIVIRPINWSSLMQKMFPEEDGEDFEHLMRSVREVVKFLDKNRLVAQLLKLMERIILRFPPHVSDGFSQIRMTCANQMFTVSPIGFCLLELAEAKMLTTLAGKSFLRVDEVQLTMVERPTLTALAKRALIQSIRRLVVLEAYCDSREEGLQLVQLLAACRWSSVGRINVTQPMVGLSLLTFFSLKDFTLQI